MKLKEYINKEGYHLPRLSAFYKKYSVVFKDYYIWAYNNTVFRNDPKNETIFILLSNELKEYHRRLDNKLYYSNNQSTPASNEEIIEIEKIFSKGFEDGFNDLEFALHLRRNIIDNIIYRNPFSHSYFGYGILKIKGYSNENKTYQLESKEVMYREGYREGRKFKSFFIYIELYDHFLDYPQPFLRPLKYFKNEAYESSIHFTEKKDFDLKRVQNIDAKDNRLIVKQNAEELINLFTTRLDEWYSDEDIKHFLKANFKCFLKKEKPKLLNSNQENTSGLKTILNKITYELFEMQGKKREKRIRFAEMLKNNFTVFEDTSLGSIDSNLSRYKN